MNLPIDETALARAETLFPDTLPFNAFHRLHFKKHHYAMDIDCIWIHGRHPVAILDEKAIDEAENEYSAAMYGAFAEHCNLPFYELRHELPKKENCSSLREWAGFLTCYEKQFVLISKNTLGYRLLADYLDSIGLEYTNRVLDGNVWTVAELTPEETVGFRDFLHKRVDTTGPNLPAVWRGATLEQSEDCGENENAK